MQGLGMSCASALAMMIASSASAQQTPDVPATGTQAPTSSRTETQAPKSSQPDGGVSDIIVTAQRVAQSLQTVPVSVQPVTGADLANRQISDLVQLQTAVPSLGIGTDNTFTLRGVGSLSFSPEVDSSVGVAIDDVSLGVPLFMNYFGFEDVDRVEVLLGPQGLLFGRNASAGLLNIVSKRPELGGRISGHAYAETDYRDATPDGGWGEILRGTLNVPLTSDAALRLNGFYSDQDPIATVVARGPNAHFGNYQARFGFKGKFLYEPAGGLSVYLIGDFARNRGIGGLYDRTARYSAPNSVTAAFLAKDGITAGPDNLKLGYSAPAGGGDIDTGGGSATISYKFSNHLTISDIVAYRYYTGNVTSDQDPTSSDGVDLNFRDGKYRQISNELRAAFNTGAFLDGQVGVYYFDSLLREQDAVGAAAYHILDPMYAALVGPSNSVTNPYIGTDLASRVRDQSYAGFGQVNVHPIDRVTVILGGRVTRDDDHVDLVQNQRFYLVPLGAPNYRASERVTNTDFSWKVGGQYDLPGLGMIYATYSKGYKGPAFNDTAATAGQRLAIGPETVHALELGAKTTFLDHRLRVNIAAFRDLFDNFQVQGFDSRTSSYFTANAAKVKSQGIEAFLEAKPVQSLTLSASGTLLDSRIRLFNNDHCYPGQPTCSAMGTSDSSGNRTPSSAKFTSNVTANYVHPVSNDASLSLLASWYHRSSINFSSNANPQQGLGAINTLDGSIGLTIDKRYRISAFCKNCTNKIFPVFIGADNIDAAVLGINSTVQTFGYNSLRTIGVSAGFDF